MTELSKLPVQQIKVPDACRIAAENGHLDLVKYFYTLDGVFDPYTAEAAIWNKHWDVAKFVIEHGAIYTINAINYLHRHAKEEIMPPFKEDRWWLRFLSKVVNQQQADMSPLYARLVAYITYLKDAMSTVKTTTSIQEDVLSFILNDYIA